MVHALHEVTRPAARFVLLPVASGDPPEHLFRRLLSAYLGGTRSFQVFESPEISDLTRQVVLEFCRRTRGPELAREARGTLELLAADRAGPAPLGDRLRRLGTQVLLFHREAVASWDRLPLGDDGLWTRRDDDVDREAWYLERCLALGEDDGSFPATAAWTIARSLERIADHAVTLGEVGPRLAEVDAVGSALRELRQFHVQTTRHLDEVLQGPDEARANDLLDVGEALLASGRALSERLLPAVGGGSMSPASAAAVARALEAMVRTVAYTQDIAQAFLDRALRLPGATTVAPGLIGAPAR